MTISNEEMIIEEKHLERTNQAIKEIISNLGQQLYDKEEKIKEFQKFMWDTRHDMDPTEMRTMEATNDVEVNLVLRKSKYYQKLFKVQNSPYFGAIVFKEDNLKEKFYIGITYVNDKENNHLVYDWRAPISSLFYDYEIGPAKYQAPKETIKGEILNKRQFKIQNGKLIRVFDSSINIDDDVLQEVLTSKTSDKMKNIVNTIQQEQNAIIRNTSDRNLIVQGIAGSGKTSVALHRIAFLLYKIENLNSKNILIFSPNQVFSEYISNVLPELGEENTMQTTFNDFLSRYINEFKKVESFTDFIERYYKRKQDDISLIEYKQSDEIIEDINNYIKDIIKSVKINGSLKTTDFEIPESELNYMLNDRYAKLNLFERLQEISIKISRDKYHENKVKAKSIYKTLLKMLSIKKDYKQIYINFYKSKYFQDKFGYILSEKNCQEIIKSQEIKYEDACLFAYIKAQFEGFDYQGGIKQVVIDEAQDYNKLQYVILKKIFVKSEFTILGDINQTVNPYYKYNSLEDLIEVFGKEETKYLELNKTYRSTPEIIEYTNKILDLKHVSAIRKELNKPVIIRKKHNNITLIDDINRLRKNFNSIAVITKTDEDAAYLHDILKEEIKDISLIDSSSQKFNKKLVILPSYVAKGLEFDSVIIYNASNYYTKDKYLYYVACTRSQHELIIYK